MNPIKYLQKTSISLIVIVIALTIISPSPALSQTQNKETKTVKMKTKQHKLEEKKLEEKKLEEKKLEEKKKRRAERIAKRKKRKRVLRKERFNIMSPKMAEATEKSSKSVLKVDADFGGLYLVKSIFVTSDSTGQNFINILIQTLDTKSSIYNFNMQILDKSGKKLAVINTSIFPSGRKLRKGQILLGSFKIENALVPKISDYAISIKIPAPPILKSGGHEVLKVKVK